MRWVPIILSLLLAGCGQDDAGTVRDRFFKMRRILFEQPDLLGTYYDGAALVIVYTDKSKLNGTWLRFKCYPPASKSRWYCEQMGDPTKSVFLDE